MHIAILQRMRDAAKEREDFWFHAHQDAETEQETNDYGWLWTHEKELREKLDSMLTPNA